MHKIYSQLKGFYIYNFSNFGTGTELIDMNGFGYDESGGDLSGDGTRLIYCYGDGIRHGGTGFTDDDFLMEEANA
jgi:hypothetical protein